MKRYVLMIFLLMIILTGCTTNQVSNMTEAQKQSLYFEKVEESISDEIGKDIKIISSKEISKNNEIVLYTYYNIPNQKNFIGLKLAALTNNNLEMFNLSENGENYADKYPISFSSLFHEYNDGKKYMITYGIIYENNIKTIKLIYNDGKSFEEPVTGNGYIIIRNDYIGGAKQIIGIDKNSSIVYKFPEKTE